MITADEILKFGTFLKPHGIKGELNAQLDYDEMEITDFGCIVIDIDGIFVPFYIDGVRPKSAHTELLHIEGINTEAEAKEFTGKTIYVLRRELPENPESEDNEGFYLSDLISFRIISDNDSVEIGSIEDFDDSTENALFIVRPSEGSGNHIYIPATDEFITGINPDERTITMNLPEGLTSLN